MKYKIIKSDLFLNGKLIPENSEVELSEDQTKGLEEFLIPISHPELVSGSSESETNNNANKKSKGNK